jgi:hypothetical protein
MPLLAVAGSIGSAVVGGLFGSGQTKTQTPTYTPNQLAIQGQEGATISKSLAGADLAPMKTAAMSDVNRNYADITKRLQTSFSARGFGRSGNLLTNQMGLEVSRAGDMGSLDSRFAGLQLQQENTAVQQAQQFGFAGGGSTTQTSTPGGVAGNALNSQLSTLTTLYGLNKMLSQGGGGGGGGYASGYGPTNSGPSWDPNSLGD